MKADKIVLCKILEECIIDALDLIKKQKEIDKEKDWNWTFDHHDNYPTIVYLANGLPSFHLSSYHKIDYSKFLNKDKKHLEISSWNKYHDYVISNEDLRFFFGLGEYSPIKSDGTDDIISIYNQFATYYFLSNFADSYIHRNSESLQFNSSLFECQFEKYFSSINLKELQVTIVVPILHVVFDIEEYIIDERISIKRIENSIQLARNKRKSYTSSAHEVVIGAATHAFFIKNWTVPNETRRERDETLNEINAYKEAKSIIENLFAALRLALNAETGYCQILSIPVNWEYCGKSDLPEIFVASEKNYPEKFEDFGWNSPLQMIFADDLENYREIYNNLRNVQFSLALRRLNSASVRKNEEDSILDITIALESLLTNDSTSEITYRLAVRAAQLCKLSKFKNYDPMQVFDLCKKIYSYRSAVVHGDLKKIEKSKKIILNQSEEIKIIEISIELLKHVIKSMITLNICTTKQIDELMM